MISINDLAQKFREVKVEDNQFVQDEFKEAYYDSLPEDIGKGTPREVADRVHKYDSVAYQAFRHAAGDAMVDAIINDTEKEIGSLEMTGEVSGLKFSSVFSRPVGDKVTVKDYQASLGFGYGMSKAHTAEKKQIKSLAERLYEALEKQDEKEEASEDATAE